MKVRLWLSYSIFVLVVSTFTSKDMLLYLFAEGVVDRLFPYLPRNRRRNEMFSIHSA